MIDAHGSPVRPPLQYSDRLGLKQAQQVSREKVLFHNDDDDEPVSGATWLPACCVLFVSCIVLAPVIYRCLSLFMRVQIFELPITARV